MAATKQIIQSRKTKQYAQLIRQVGDDVHIRRQSGEEVVLKIAVMQKNWDRCPDLTDFPDNGITTADVKDEEVTSIETPEPPEVPVEEQKPEAKTKKDKPKKENVEKFNPEVGFAPELKEYIDSLVTSKNCVVTVGKVSTLVSIKNELGKTVMAYTFSRKAITLWFKPHVADKVKDVHYITTNHLFSHRVKLTADSPNIRAMIDRLFTAAMDEPKRAPKPDKKPIAGQTEIKEVKEEA